MAQASHTPEDLTIALLLNDICETKVQAADLWGIPRPTFQHRIKMAQRAYPDWKPIPPPPHPEVDLEALVDYTLYQYLGSFSAVARARGCEHSAVSKRVKRAERTFANLPKLEPAAEEEKVEEEPLAMRQERKLKDEINRLKRELNATHRELNAIEDFRETIFGLGKPTDPATHPVDFSTGPEVHDEIPIVFGSDFQWGERIELEEMDRLNAYNRDIAVARLRRFIEGSIDCCLSHHVGGRPPAVYYLRGGDAISGDIHAELAETNDLSSIPAVKDLAAHEQWAINTLRDQLGCQVFVVSVPGNHDRSYMKPRYKKYVQTSFDSVITWHLEMMFRDDPMVKFLTPPHPDAYFQIYNTRFLLTHGDNMGTGGGTGYIGPIAAITKGHRKIAESYQSIGKPVDCVLTGHFHTAVETEYGFGNGSLPGFGEYAKLKIRAKPAPPVQWLLHVHPRRGITTRRQIMVGHPSEGSLCADLEGV